MSQAEHNVKIVNDAYAAFFRGDVIGFFANCADDIEIVEADSLPYGGTFRGKEDGAKGLLMIQGSWDDMSFEMEEMLASPTMIAAIGRLRGKAKATGIAIDMPIVELWRFRDGKVQSISPIYGDTQLTNAALSGKR